MVGAGLDSADDDADVRLDRLLELARRPDDPGAPQTGRPWRVSEIAAALQGEQTQILEPHDIHEVAEVLTARPSTSSQAFLDRLTRLLGAPASYFDPNRSRPDVEAELLVEQLRRCGVARPLICRARLQPSALVQTLETALELASSNPIE